MKTNILSLAVIGFMAGTIATSCGESSKKDMKAVKEDVKELNKDLRQGAEDTSTEIKTTVSSDWKKFEASSKTILENTDKQIKELRVKISKANKNEKAKLTADLDKLEQKNKELKEKLAERSRKFKENLIEFEEGTGELEKSFEREFKHDMDELGTSLKDLFKNNVE